jgi:putative tryptophan/tyrosine transport system substrate-binding protein
VNKKIAVFIIVTGVLALVQLAEAQQPAKVVRIGVALGGTATSMKYLVDAFHQGLRELGYIEGKNVLIEYRYTEGRPERSAEIAEKIIGLKPDIIVVHSTALTASCKNATSTIPIVVGNAGDLVGPRLVESLARPGGNITGSTSMATDLAAKRLEIAKEIVPKLSRLGVVWHGLRGFSDELELMEIQAAARQLGIAVQPVEVRDPKEFQAPYASLIAQKTDAIVLIQGTFTDRYNKELSELAAKSRLPSVCEGSQWAENGCLISYGPDRTYSWRRAAYFVDRILKGTKPADLPIEQPTKFELAVNMKTAKALGIKIPNSILIRADRVIE